MNKKRTILLIISIVLITALLFTGCNSQDQKFTYSRDIDNNGYWRGIKASNYVELGTYIGLSIPKNTYTVTEDELQSNLTSILQDHLVKTDVYDRDVVYGDTLNIDYIGRVDGVAFEGGSTGGNGADVTIGVTNYIDDFLEQLIGHMPKETFDIEVTFPEDYGDEQLNGKDAIFTITINHIVESSIPELTDEFVNATFSESNGWTTVEQMKSGLTENIKDTKVSEYIQDYLTANSTIKEIPQMILDFQDEAIILFYQNYATQYQMELDDFLKQYVGVENQQQLLEQYKEDNEKVSEMHLVIQAVAEDAKIKATKDDVQNYFENYMQTDDYSQYEEIYGLNYLKLTTLVQMVLDHIQDNAVFE